MITHLRSLYLVFCFLLVSITQSVGQSQTFTASQSFTVPSGVTTITVQCWGGGGAGGRGGSANKNGGGGGAGGQFASKSLSVTAGQVYSVVVGSGGTVTATNGNPGGDSYFGANLVLAKGGAGGGLFNGTSGPGGIGSTASAVGTIIYAGGTGASGSRQQSGGGGGGAGSLGAGNAASGITGGVARANNGGSGGNGTNANSANGNNGSLYGAGGGGATRTGVPGAGAPGLVIVSWSCSVALSSSAGTDAQTICINSPIVPITYQFSGVTGATVAGLPSGITSSYNSTTNVLVISGTPVVAGAFSYTVTPVGGCTSASASGIITVSSPAVSAGPALSAICQGGSSSPLGGSVSGGATGGNWSDGGAGGVFSPSSTNLNATYTPPAAFTGTVTLTLTSTGGACASISASKTLTVNPAPSASISYAGTPYCASIQNASVTLVGTSGGTFSVAPAGITINSTTGAFSPSSSIPGNYTVTYAITTGGCNFSTSTSVVVKALPQVACSAAGIITCTNLTSTLSAGATASTGSSITGYSWIPGGATSATLVVSNGTSYTVTVTQSNGCSSTCSIAATVDTCRPSVSVSSSGGSCSGVATTLTASTTACPGNSISYSWNTGATTSSITTSTAGTYTVTASQSVNGCTASASRAVSPSSTPVIVTTSAAPVACNGGSTTVLVSASGGTQPYSGTGSFTVTAGTYTYTVTDASGCTGSASITISQPVVLTATAVISTPITCFGGTGVISVSASGGTAPYSGTGPRNATAGTTTYTVTDARGCTATTSALTLTQPSQLVIIVSTTPTNCGSFIGTASASVSGGVSPYSYSWSNGQTGPTASNLAGGTYIVTITDAIGCTATASAQVGVIGGSPIDITGPIIGPAGACLKTVVTYSVNPVSGASAYTWTLPFGASGTSSSNAITVYFDSTFVGGSICVTPSNPCVTGNTVCINIPAITTRPAQPGTATVTGNVCGPDTLTVSVAPVAFTTNYVWSVSGTLAVIVGGQGTTVARIAIPAGFTNTQLGIQAFNCIGSSAIKYQTIVGKPVINTGLVGPTTICPNVTQSYSVGAALGATSYSWSITGDAIIQSSNNNTCVVQSGPAWSGGVLTVTASNNCGSGYRSFNLYKNVAQPGSITGPATNLCIAAGTTTASYSISPVSGAISYVWTVPAGMTITSNSGTSINVSIDATYTAGSVCVAGVNACGTGPFRCLYTTQAPPIPSVINGATNVCKSNSFSVYGVNTVVGAIDYGWYVNNGTGLTPYGTACVLNFLTSTAPSSSLQVNSINECASSQPYRITIYIDATCRTAAPANDASRMVIYPNPVTGQSASLRVIAEKEGLAQIQVHDLTGRVLLDKLVDLTNGWNSFDLPSGEWTSGVYLVRMLLQDGQVHTIRLVVN